MIRAFSASSRFTPASKNGVREASTNCKASALSVCVLLQAGWKFHWMEACADEAHPESSLNGLQNMLAAILMVNARMAVLKANDSSDCSKTRRRIACVETLTSAVCEATAMVNEKYRKSP